MFLQHNAAFCDDDDDEMLFVSSKHYQLRMCGLLMVASHEETTLPPYERPGEIARLFCCRQLLKALGQIAKLAPRLPTLPGNRGVASFGEKAVFSKLTRKNFLDSLASNSELFKKMYYTWYRYRYLSLSRKQVGLAGGFDDLFICSNFMMPL